MKIERVTESKMYIHRESDRESWRERERERGTEK